MTENVKPDSLRIEIAPSFSCIDWRVLKKQLSDDGRWESFENPWKEAIRIIRSRIQVRFINCIDSLSSRRYAGFTVLAIDCLLLEAIQAFKRGYHTKNPKQSRAAYKELLLNSPHFAPWFADEKSVDDFYTYVRNGLLHDGETRKGYLVKTKGKLLEKMTNGSVLVNRKAFHHALCQEFTAYVDQLSHPIENQLRRNLVTAIDGVCERSSVDWKVE